MARIRTIKPEFWQDEKLATKTSRDARLLFIGLLNLADDEGRLRGNHLFIHAHVFPYEPDVDVAGCLRELSCLGRLVQYTHEGEQFIWLCKFEEHQRIDRPKPSTLPQPPPQDESSMRRRCVDDASSQKVAGREGKGKEQGKEGKGREQEASPAAVEELRAAWNGHTTLARWEKTPGPRLKAATNALARRPLHGPEGWVAVFQRIQASAFCAGANDQRWVADIDWALRPDGKKAESALLVLEGRYDNRGGATVPAVERPPCVTCGGPSNCEVWGQPYCYANGCASKAMDAGAMEGAPA